MRTYAICVKVFDAVFNIAEFLNKEDAEKAMKWLEKKYGGEYFIRQEVLYESFDSFMQTKRDYLKDERVI